ncbi:AAA family ATPase [Phormidium sp. LEGE 05292]|uniref:trifunctional serine/threonine-protein kinase/ATP-binding protein/sensor histidine kinase n=1 Tax=[Phormidium] sp. LEGE 05292 TaxID=767427 RepID=UPI001882A18B|nr:ATP-binding sensor histidine kinase [Phormidium sp. LEGE 05292]MBE9226142.1 AAA family ATPase [Phormidium sp. LEGE 05292]
MINLLGYSIRQQIYAGTRTLVYQGVRESDRQPVVIKLLQNEFPRFSELLHFRNQYIIAKSLDIPGIIKPYSLETYQNRYALILEDFDGISLCRYVASLAESKTKSENVSLPIAEFFPISIQIADTLDRLYRDRVIHKDLKPANILINPISKEVKIIDFSIASLLPRETQEIQNPNVLEGTLPYISPEQTGRMNRGIDYRTDFYSLGITFYELLTGQLPFQTNDPMELVHCHLAKQPTPIHELNSAVPLILSEIVGKLMAKNAEDRYQSATGLKYDLETCWQQWRETGEIATFKLGQRDLCDRFFIPEKLYGREAEVQTLLEAFDRVASLKENRVSAGNTEMMLVAGFSGIGKTAVVNEVHKPIVRQRGYFIKGKFDQFQRNLPFSAFVQAFRDLIGQLLSEPDVKIEQWKSEILAALGENAGAIVEIVPELKFLIGEQPAVPELSGSAAQNRFNLLFEKFIQVFTTKEHPLVIFLDDLQWADSASLKLIQLLMSNVGSRYLFLIGAYRDNEVFPAHPLMLTLADIQTAAATVNTITLSPLQKSDVNALIADTLGCSKVLAQPLTELVYQKTKGNPFFGTQFLKSLQEDGLISFNFDLRHWQCDIAKVRTLALTDDVVEFVAIQLRKLPIETQEVLRLAACIGNQFDLATLAIVDEKSPEETALKLWKALQEGLILPISEVYKFYQAEVNEKEENGNREESNRLPITHDQLPQYRFLHDRIQQAAYSLIPEEQKRSTHLQIGQLLLKNTPEADREERIFDIVNHLNVGVELITHEAEREQLIQLNLIAGKKAKAATAYSAAVEYFNIGRELLAVNSWQNQYELTLALHTEAAEAAYLSGDFDRMEKLASVVESCAKMLLDKVKVYEVQVQAYMAQNKLQEALNTGLQVLKQLGVEFPSEPNPSDIGQALGETASILSGTRIEDLIELPQMSDRYKLAAMKLLSSIFAPAYIAAPTLLPLTVCKQVQLSIEYGNATVSPFAYANYGFLLCAIVGDIDSGYKFGQLALNLMSKLNAQEIKTKTVFIVNLFIRPWKEHLKETLEPFLSSYSSGMETGDLEYAGYCLQQYSCFAYFSGKELTVLETEIARNREASHKIKQETALNYIEIYRQAILNLLGKSENLCLLKGEACDEQMKLPLYQQANDKAGVAYIYLNKLLLCYWFENYSEAIENIAIAEKYLDAVVGMPLVPVFHFYDSLVRLAVYSDTPESEQQKLLYRVQANQEKMQKWAHHAPMNHLHKFYLVEAELHRVLDEKLEAIELYDKAIALAKENEYVNEEALANELAAKFYLEWGKEKLAKPYLIDAYYAYTRWGAKAKIDHLEQRYPQFLATILQPNQAHQHPNETIHISTNGASSISSTSKTIIGSTSSSEFVDLPTVIEASQTLSSEIELEQLLTTLMQVVVKNAGAETGTLILNEEGNWRVVVHCINRQDCHLESLLVEESQAIPGSLINYVKRTKEILVFDNLSTQTAFASDPYIIQRQPKSVLCTPILHQGKVMGILYLENNLVTGAFTRDRVAILNILCSQAAISLDNARLYQQSQRLYQQSQEYAQKLEQYLHDLKKMQLQLVQSEKMSALGNLVAGVAHEINNPVGFLAGNIQPAQEYVRDLFNLIDIYQEKFPDPGAEIEEEIDAIDLEYLREDLPKLIGSMNEGIDRIRNISTSLRTFSRADSDRPVPFNIHDGLDSTILILKHRLKANENRPAIQVIKEFGTLPLVKCFPGQLNQVFMNILANAIDALEESNKERSFSEIQAHPNQITIQTAANEKGDCVLIRIKDNGVGMSEEIKHKLFDQLFTTKLAGQGTGLGLSIARQIVVEKHGGTLEVNSCIGCGSEFLISMPT